MAAACLGKLGILRHAVCYQLNTRKVFMTTLEVLRKHQTDRDLQNQQEDRAAWSRLSVGIATGELKLSPDEVFDELARLGRTLDDLHHVKYLATRRQELALRHEKLPTLEETAEKSRQTFLKVRDEVARKQEELDGKLRAAAAKSNDSEADVREARHARRELLETCSKSIRDELAQLRDEIVSLESRRGESPEIDDQLDQHRREVERLEAEAMQPGAVD
jgi:hypothetical protein